MNQTTQTLLQDASKKAAGGHFAQALQILDKARLADPLAVAVYIEMAACFVSLNQPDAARLIFKDAHKKIPDDFDILNRYANCCYQTDKCAEVFPLTQAALKKKNCPTALWLTHANLAKALGKIKDAQHIYENILTREPDNINVLSNRGGLYLDEGDNEKAIHFFENALACDPPNAHIRTQLALAYFRKRDLKNGWRYYTARFDNGVNRRPFPQPLWQGQAVNAALLLWGEQAIGEEILYAHFLKQAAAKTPQLYVECDARLQPLLQRSFPDCVFVSRQTPFDARLNNARYQAALGDCGGFFRKDFADFPDHNGFLVGDAAHIQLLRKKYEKIKAEKNIKGKIIGFSWKSKKLRHGDPKSTSLDMWAPLFTNSDHLFIDLQYGVDADEIKFMQDQGWNIFHDDAVDQAQSLDDFAAQTAAMDSVISVSNTTAHMAGALGISGYVLLPKSKGLMGHWFDGLGFDGLGFDGLGFDGLGFDGLGTSPWYPSLTLLRQTTDGVWDDVFSKLAQKIG